MGSRANQFSSVVTSQDHPRAGNTAHLSVQSIAPRLSDRGPWLVLEDSRRGVPRFCEEMRPVSIQKSLQLLPGGMAGERISVSAGFLAGCITCRVAWSRSHHTPSNHHRVMQFIPPESTHPEIDTQLPVHIRPVGGSAGAGMQGISLTAEHNEWQGSHHVGGRSLVRSLLRYLTDDNRTP